MANLKNKTILGFILLIGYIAISVAIYFFSAGRLDLPFAWVYFSLNLVLGLAFSAVMAGTNPELIAERVKPGPGEQDRVFKGVGLPLVVLKLILAGLDAGRYHWTAPVSAVVQVTALILVVVGYFVLAWATFTNRFFSSAVRLQPDRQQVVIDKGPYAVVRHPGYIGAILYLPFSGLALGSWVATVIAGIPLILLILRRTLLEDAMLRRGLPGYDAYAARPESDTASYRASGSSFCW